MEVRSPQRSPLEHPIAGRDLHRSTGKGEGDPVHAGKAGEGEHELCQRQYLLFAFDPGERLGHLDEGNACGHCAGHPEVLR